MSRRLLLLTEIISPYRIPVFNALARQEGIDLHVVFLAETDPYLRQWLVYKEEMRFSYEILRSWRRRFGKHHLLLNRGLASAMQSASPDVIVCGGYNYIASWQALWWARRRHTPFIVWLESTAKDLRTRRALVEFLKMRFMRNCNGFIAAGKSSFEYVKGFGVSSDDIFTAPDAVDTAFFERQAESTHSNAEEIRKALQLPERFFLFVGRLIPEKGVFDLLDAYGMLDSELRAQIGLVFVGEGPARAELERLAATISPGSIHFAGFAQREQLAAYYTLAEAFVFPTHTDPWGLVVNEAMACGLPIIASNAAGCTADLVEDGWNGRVVPARKPMELASAMNEMLQDAERRSLMSKHSRERIQKFSPGACAAGIAEAALSCGAIRHG